MEVTKPNLILYGKVIAVSGVKEIPSKEAGKAPMKKRELYLDCTQYDGITGVQIGSENKPLLEFGGDKVIEKIAALNLVKGDIVGVRFAIQGTPYKDNEGKQKVFTSIRCYDIDVVRKAGQNVAPQTTQAQPQPQTQQAGGGDEGLPF